MLSKKWCLTISVASLIFTTRIYFFDYYRVPSVSMLPTIRPNSIVIVNRLYFPCKSRYKFLKSKIEKGQIYVFYRPDSKRSIEYVKRCFAMPGEIVSIKRAPQNDGYQSRVNSQEDLFVFPHDSAYHWSLNIFGPIIIPKKGMCLQLTTRNIALYKEVLNYEGLDIKLLISEINQKGYENYCFKNNFYFMLGDNFYESEDSRIFGFVPEKNFIGKVAFIF